MRKITVIALGGLLALGALSLDTKPAKAGVDFYFGFGPFYAPPPPPVCYDLWGRPYYCNHYYAPRPGYKECWRNKQGEKRCKWRH